MIDHVRVFVVVRSHVSEAIVFVATAVVTMAINLVTAIEVGLLLAGVLALRKMASGSVASAEELADHDDDSVDETRTADRAHRRLPARRRPVLWLCARISRAFAGWRACPW